jgi:thiol-disulfide isomerase/thioredoxin
MKAILSSFALLVAAAVSMHAADAAPSAKLSQFKLGAYITGPEATLDTAAGKAVLIDAWGIHCGPCLASLPDIEKIAKRYKDKMLVFGAHSQAGTDDEVKEVVKKNKLTYTITKGVNSPIAFSGIPRVFVFDTTGALVFTGSPFDQEFERSLRKATAGASGSAGAKPSGLDALKKPGA